MRAVGGGISVRLASENGKSAELLNRSYLFADSVHSFQCDTAPYCEACEAPAKEAAEPSKGQHDHSSLPSLRKTCSLGPGRTVPCDFKGKGPIIAFGGDKESFAANVKMTSHRKTCIINQDTEVPCYSKGDVIVFGN